MSTYFESNLGRQTGVQLSAVLKDSEESIKLKTKCKSTGCMKHFFIRTRLINWFFPTKIAKTTFGS